MIELSLIDKEKSIETGRLIFKRDWLDYSDKIVFCFIAVNAIVWGVAMELDFPYDGIFTGFLIFFLAPLFILFGLYGAYRKLYEDELICINTTLSKKENVEKLKAFLNKSNYTINQENNEIITVVDEHEMSYNGLWRKQYVFLINDFEIYFNIRKLYPIISPPVLFSHILLRSDLKKYFK